MTANEAAVTAFVARVLPCNCFDLPCGDRIRCVHCQVTPALVAAIIERDDFRERNRLAREASK